MWACFPAHHPSGLGASPASSAEALCRKRFTLGGLEGPGQARTQFQGPNQLQGRLRNVFWPCAQEEEEAVIGELLRGLCPPVHTLKLLSSGYNENRRVGALPRVLSHLHLPGSSFRAACFPLLCPWAALPSSSVLPVTLSIFLGFSK